MTETTRTTECTATGAPLMMALELAARSGACTPWWRAARDVSGFPSGGTV